LLELVIVLVLISLSIALVGPSLSRVARTIELKAAAKKVSGILRYYRSEAVNKGQIYQVLFDSDLREVRVQTVDSTKEKQEEGKLEGKGEEKALQKKYSLPGEIKFKEVKTAPSQYSSGFPAIEFYPNGTSNGGSILLDSQDRKGYKIKVHFLTGVVEIERV